MSGRFGGPFFLYTKWAVMETKNWTAEFGIHQQTLEGHGIIRAAAAVGALALLVGCVLETVDWEENIQHPPRLLLKAYTA